MLAQAGALSDRVPESCVLGQEMKRIGWSDERKTPVDGCDKTAGWTPAVCRTKDLDFSLNEPEKSQFLPAAEQVTDGISHGIYGVTHGIYDAANSIGSRLAHSFNETSEVALAQALQGAAEGVQRFPCTVE